MDTLRPSLELAAEYLYRDATDFLKSYHGLLAIIELELGRNPFTGELDVT